MKVITALATCAATAQAFQDVLAPRNWLGGTCHTDRDVEKLGEGLSDCAKVYCPGSAEFERASTRWSAHGAPQPELVVIVCTEEDVSKTVSDLL
ncbi:hypothetical protein IMZ48_04635 [Candidatus Bathyarchaeota archaeon]|nr:hypothetical protein [Candidatus Bathyarchaeota archaeon]